MLAYVFWHWRRPAVDRDTYEALQRRFHAALADAPPPGFGGSRTGGIDGAPWAAGGQAAYEDWYLVEGSAALDPLNEAAVSAARQQPHDAAAAGAADGIAGLYRLRLGDPRRVPRVATWFAKPAGMPYAALWEAFAPVVTAGATLWGRQMTLGPTPEFCLHTDDPASLPAGFSAHTVTRIRPIWP